MCLPISASKECRGVPELLTAKKHGFLLIFLFYALNGTPYSISDLELPLQGPKLEIFGFGFFLHKSNLYG